MKKSLFGLALLSSSLVFVGLGITSTAQADTMYCETTVYKGLDLDAVIAGKTPSANIFRKVEIDVTPIPHQPQMFEKEDSVNGTKFVFNINQLGISDAYEMFVFSGTSLTDADERIIAQIYPDRLQNGKPGTGAGDWPFPGENLGYVYEYINTANSGPGGVVTLGKNVVAGLKKLGLWSGRYSSAQMSLSTFSYNANFVDDYKALKKNKLVKKSDLIYVHVGGCNKL